MKPTNSQLIGMLEITHINIALSAKAGKQKRKRINQEILHENPYILNIVLPSFSHPSPYKRY